MPRRRKQDEQAVANTSGADAELERFVDRVEKLEEERRGIVVEMNEVLVEAADRGFPKKAIKGAVKRRLETPEAQAKRIADEEALEDVLRRLGMLADTPLGLAATVHALHPQPQ